MPPGANRRTCGGLAACATVRYGCALRPVSRAGLLAVVVAWSHALVHRRDHAEGGPVTMTVEIASPALEFPTTAPLGAHHDGHGASFAVFSSVAEPSSCACSTRRAKRPGGVSNRATGSSGRAICPTRGHANAMAIASTVPGTLRQARGATRQNCCSTLTPARLPAMSGGTRRCTAMSPTTRVDLMTRTRRRTSRVRC